MIDTWLIAILAFTIVIGIPILILLISETMSDKFKIIEIKEYNKHNKEIGSTYRIVRRLKYIPYWIRIYESSDLKDCISFMIKERKELEKVLAKKRIRELDDSEIFREVL